MRGSSPATSYDPPMRTALLSIGDELALGQKHDAHGPWLAARLAAMAAPPSERRVVGDDRALIAGAIAELAARSDVLVITGGLGPTADDLTRHALADALGARLVVDEDALVHLRQLFRRRKRPMPVANEVQAMRPEGMRCLDNPRGTAPGLAGRMGACAIFALPGPPREMHLMFEHFVEPVVAESSGSRAVVAAEVHAYGLGESDAAELLGELMDRSRDVLTGTTVSDGILTARIRAAGPPEETRAAVDRVADEVETLWRPYAFGRGACDLSAAVGRLLSERTLRLATAESCTGGWLGKRLVDVAGSSAYYLGGIVSYSDDLKVSALGVPPALLERHGAVSAEVAAAMAEGARATTGADLALSITGIAGPDGGTASKPVGTVFVGLAADSSSVRRFQFASDRAGIRARSVMSALQMLRFHVLGVEASLRLLWQVRDPITVTLS